MFNFIKNLFKKPESKYGKGGVPNQFDARDYDWTELGSASLPFDWSKGFDIESKLQTQLVTKDQNGSFSCGGQAFSYLGEVLEAIATGTYEPRSAKFSYSQVFYPGGGSTARDNADIAIKQGWPREVILSSYDMGVPPSEYFMTRFQDITLPVLQDASLAKGLVYADVSPNIDTVAQAIRDNYGAILLVQGSNNGTWESIYPKPPIKTEWRHFLYAGKAVMLNGKKYIVVKNSWGNVGVDGWQWLGEEWFGGAVQQVTTMVFKTEVVIPPAFRHNFKTNLTFGENNGEVKALQQALYIEKCFPDGVPFTGYFGNITANANLKFQLKYGITPTSANNCGPKTRAKLNEIFFA